jgi:hypothetical protein
VAKESFEKVAEYIEEHLERSTSRGVPREECLERSASRTWLSRRLIGGASPHHQRTREVQPGDKTPHKSSEDLPQQGVVCAAGESTSGGTSRRSGLQGSAT